MMGNKSWRAVAALATCALVTLLPTGGTAASRCDSQLVVFSRNSGNVGSVNWNGVVCLPGAFVEPAKAAADGPADFRLINPQSDLIQVRYADDIRFKPAIIKAVVNGLGFANKVVYLGRENAALAGEEPSWVYDGPELAIDPAAQGCLTVRATYSKRVSKTKVIKVLDERTTYHTVDTPSC